MFRQKTQVEEDAYLPFFEDEEEKRKKALKRRKQGCLLWGVSIGVILICAALALGRAKQNETAADDGALGVMYSGLDMTYYAGNGSELGQYGETNKEPAPQGLVSLSALRNRPTALDALAYPEGAFYDDESAQLVVFGAPTEPNSPPASADFLTALRAVYSSQDPAVSIDPIGSETTQAARYYGQTEETHFGWVMFESDRVMKTLSMGQDNITGKAVSAQVQGFANMFDLELQMGMDNPQEVRRRFWFTIPEAVMEESPDGKGMVITTLRLAVETEYLDENWQTISNQPPDPAGQAFAQHLSANYADYAREFPVLRELEALARWTALAHWLKHTSLPLQPELWLVNAPDSYDTPQTTPAITATRQESQGNTIRTLMLWGGVDFSMKAKFQQAGATAQATLHQALSRFRAWILPAHVKVSSGIAPIYTSGITDTASAQVELPFALASKWAYADGQWQISLPRLIKQGVGENAFFLLEDGVSAPIILTYEGYDEKEQTHVFANRSAGRWLKEFSDAYIVGEGKFSADGAFSYQPGEFILFDTQGQILRDTVAGVEYEYQQGKLARIHHTGEEIRIEWNADGTVSQIASDKAEARFAYQERKLVEINGALQRRFSYDEKGRLFKEMDAGGNVLRLTKYNTNRQVLFQIQDGLAALYEWHEDGTVKVYHGAALLPWQDAEEKDLEDLAIALGLGVEQKADEIFFARRVGSQLVMFSHGNSYSVPGDLLNNPARLREKLADLSKEINQPDKIILTSHTGLEGISFHPLFSRALAVDAQNMDKTRIVRNLEILRNTSTFSPSSARVINAVPLPEQLTEVGLQDPLEYWRDMEADGQPAWKTSIDESILQGGFSSASESSPRAITSALTQDAQVIFVVAHYDGLELRLPSNSGEVFNLSSLSPAEKKAIAENHPLVILLSCDTAAPSAGGSFAQQLLEIGPSMVIAPNGALPVKDVPKILKAYSLNAKLGISAWQAFKLAIHSIYETWLIPDNDGVERFFEFLTRKTSPVKRS